jgi:predicted metal-dependent peptidase
MADPDHEKIRIKLAAARTRLILDKPFLGALVLRLPMVEASPEWCSTTGTDAKQFYYNPGYINSLTLAQTQFMLAHEALHCALSHFSRRQSRVLHRWNIACAYAINPLLVEDGLTPPYDTLIMDEYRGMTAEEIYPLLQEDDNQETIDEHLYDESSNSSGEGDQENKNNNPPPDDSRKDKQQQEKGDKGEDNSGGRNQQRKQGQNQPQPGSNPQPPPLTPEERETLEIQWQQRMAGAAQQAIQAGKMDGAMARMIDHLLQPRLPWRMLLSRYMTSVARDDYSYMRQSRRSQGDAILPSLRSNQVEVVIAMDTSGSIRDREIQEFLSEVSALKGQMRARITLIPCDATIADGAPWFFEPWEELKLQTEISGGGGTDFRPVFDWVEKQSAKPQILVYFSDLEGKFPELAPAYPVLWLVKGKEKPPWGQRIQLN